LRGRIWRLECVLSGNLIPTEPANPLVTPDLSRSWEIGLLRNDLRALLDERDALGGRMPPGWEGWPFQQEAHPWDPPFDARSLALRDGVRAGVRGDSVVLFGVTDARTRSVLSRASVGDQWPGGWSSLAGSFAGPPAVAVSGAGELDVFAVGVDGLMYHRASVSGGWPGGWENIGAPPAPPVVGGAGGFRGPAAVAVTPAGGIEVFALSSSRSMCHDSRVAGPGVVTGGWQDLGGQFSSPPTAVVSGPDRVDVFALGLGRSLFSRSRVGGQWSPGWDDHGGRFSSPPAVVATAPDRIDVFALGLGRSLFHRSRVAGQWSPGWDDLGGRFSSPPSAVATGPDRVEVFALGLGRSAFHRVRVGGTWTADWAELIGGIFR
jgi:hypothetical protein